MYRFYYTIAKNTIINHMIGCKLPHKIPIENFKLSRY